ncbi:transcription factor 19-like isoform X1 [Sinocyclocheilus grahami]|uniref:transcription factor 19-like isoform X1 n=1 Tax=Sinocyclocheilus grahami TaxID=75366 RepID=UPI0007AC8DA1|nr:PREDICTED: transcription factor 19-like isoform X1 [Sinocyclocheilus grahami]XP_016092320.1 PREDICTED: transcription factor 19-like isoform X1 [Sinocyclocheilus grahami]
MSSGVQPCFQLLRIGLSDTNNSNAHGNESSDSVRDLYTFRPALAQCVFRLGRAPELCDVTLQSTIVSRIHAELHVERETDASGEESWKVQVKDRSSYGTWVNEMCLQQGVLKEIFDGDTLTIGGQSGRASPEFYFLFQKVWVYPLDFDAITVPKAGSFSSDIKNRIRTCSDRKPDPGVDISKLSINRATVILNSIGSLSKMNGSCWTFKKSEKTSTLNAPVFSALAPPTTPPPFQAAGEISSKSVPPSSKSRRKSAHTVLLEDDSSDDPANRRDLEDGRRGQTKKRRRLYKSESEVLQPPLPKLEQNFRSQYDVSKPSGGSIFSVPPNRQFNHIVNISSHTRGNGISLTPLRQQKPCLSGPGRRPRANSSPIYTTLGMGSENYNLTSPSTRMPKTEKARGVISRFQASTGRRRGRPRKHPLPQPSLPSPSSSSSSSSTSSSSSSSSSSEEEDDEEMAVAQGVEPCAAAHCRLPQQDTVQWIQCDDCDAWYHLDCLPHNHNRDSLLFDPNADFHCGCHRARNR